MANTSKNLKKTARIKFRLCPELQERLVRVAEMEEGTRCYIVEKCVKKLLPELEKNASFNPGQLLLAA